MKKKKRKAPTSTSSMMMSPVTDEPISDLPGPACCFGDEGLLLRVEV